MLLSRPLPSFRMTKPGPAADWFSYSSDAKSAGKGLKPIFPHIFVGALGMMYPQQGPEAESLCVPVYIWGRWKTVYGLWQINIEVAQG